MEKKHVLETIVFAVFICFSSTAWAGGIINFAETKTGTCPSSLEQHISKPILGVGPSLGVGSC